MKKEKVLHIIYDFATAGAQTVVLNYLRAMNNDPDYDITVLVCNSYSGLPYEKEARDCGYKVVYANYKEYSHNCIIKPFINWVRYQKTIYNSIRDIDADIIHTHLTGILPFACLPVFFACDKRIHTLHSDPYAIRTSFFLWGLAAFHLFGFKAIGVTETQANKAMKRYHLRKLPVVHNGLYLEKYRIVESKYKIRKELGIPEGAFVIGSVGRMDHIKNYSFLIDVFYNYQKLNNSAHLMLVGEGSEKTFLEKKVDKYGIAGKVSFLGLRCDVERMYHAMDVFMLTSFYESSSIVTVEAQVCNIRCVISDSIPESVVVSNNVNRISLQAPIDTWIAAIDNLMPKDFQTSSIDKYSMTTTIKELKSIYRTL